MNTKIKEIVINATKEMGLEIESKELQKASMSTKLYGQNGNLDSLGLVRLVSEIEEKISDTLGKDITIASEQAMSRKNSPFLSIETLYDYIIEIINSKVDA